MSTLLSNGTRVLIVDDDEDIRQIITDRLEKAGFAVVQACDGVRALVEMHRRHFDVVVTDYQMPRLNGLALLRQCRIAWPRTPVIVMSAGLSTSGELAAARDAFTYIQKPFDPAQLVALVDEAAHLVGSATRPSSESGSNASGSCDVAPV